MGQHEAQASEGNSSLTTGDSYTRAQIHNLFGGSVQSYLPMVNGVVVCACLTPSKIADIIKIKGTQMIQLKPQKTKPQLIAVGSVSENKKKPALFAIIESEHFDEAFRCFSNGSKAIYFGTDAFIGKALGLEIKHVYFKEPGNSAITFEADLIDIRTHNPKEHRLPSMKNILFKFYYGFTNLRDAREIEDITSFKYFTTGKNLLAATPGACIIEDPQAE